MKKTINVTCKTVILWIIFAVSAMVLIWKIPYGWGAYDEPFYIATPYRFITGKDAFLADEWNMAQLSYFFLLVPVKLYSMFFPDMEGVMLFFRSFFAVVHITVSLAIVFLLKDDRTAGIIASVFYLLFIPFNIINFSYDAVGLGCITLMVLLAYSRKKPSKAGLIFMGIFFSIGVLCNPYLAAVFIVYFGISLVLRIKKKNISYLNIRDFMWFFLGICLPAVLFFSFILSRTSISSILTNIPSILNDPTHGKKDFMKNISDTVREINKLYFPWIYLWMILVFFQIIDRNSDRRRKAYILFAIAVYGLSLIKMALNVKVNCYMVPFALLGINMYLISERRERRDLLLWFTGLIYAIIMWIASDQGIYVVSMAMMISVTASVFMTWNVHEETGKNKLAYIVMLVFAVQILMEIIGLSRATHWEAVRTEQLNTVYDKGPLKGLRSTEDKVNRYYLMLDDIEEYRDRTDERIAFMTMNTWEYLYVGRPYGTFSAWLGYTDEFIAEKFLNWCSLHPDKVPVQIYFSKLEEKNWDRADVEKIADRLGYDITESEISYKLTIK